MTTPDTAGSGRRLLIARDDLRRTSVVADPDSPAGRPLADGQVRLAIDRFALTSNNITYAAFGGPMKYWQFFPAPDPATWGCLPVWGFADVIESRVDGVAVGRRVYGYLPAGTHLVVDATRVNRGGFVDGAPHRADLATVYNQYLWCDADASWSPQGEAVQAVLKPLFTTSFLIDDFMAENAWFGARQLLLSSASSKTAYATAFCLARRRAATDTESSPEIVGLTSAAHVGFVRSLGCYDNVVDYTLIDALDPTVPTVYIDFAGNAALRRRVHEHYGGSLVHSSSIGGTHWSEIGSGGGLPGPRPVLFFAPAQIAKRSAPPPAGWGREAFQQHLSAAWSAFVDRIGRADDPWLSIESRSGEAALQEAYAALLDGRADARTATVVSLHD